MNVNGYHQARVQSAEYDVEGARARFAYVQRLHDGEPIWEQELEEARKALSEARTRLANANYDRCEAAQQAREAPERNDP